MRKTILITGSTDGIGKLAARRLAQEGHDVYIHGRSAEKVDRVVSEISSDASSIVEGFVADFSDLNQVWKMVEEVTQRLEKIDVLINNAGVFKRSTHIENGVDIHFVVNYLAPYALTAGLLPLLRSGKSPRIINLSSAAQAEVSMQALDGTRTLSMQEAYAQSKLALTMWSFGLAQAEPDLNVIAVNPGSLLDTKMAREVYGRSWSSAEKGGNILYDLALSSEYDGSSGKYFNNDLGSDKGSFGDAHPQAYDEGAIAVLMDKTRNLLGMK